MSKKKTKGISLLVALLLLGALPLLASSIVLTLVSASSIKQEVERETYDKLMIAAESVDQYFAYDVIANGAVDYDEYSDHVFMESVQDEHVELTLFKGDTRFLTSLKNEDGSYNEGTQANADVYAVVSAGNSYSSSDVVIGGTDYYVYYEPVYDGSGNLWGMAFAGTPHTLVTSAINSAVVKQIILTLICVVIIIVILTIVAMRIRKSISNVANSLTGLSAGDTSVRIDTSDAIIEIKDMIDATNNLQGKLSEIIGAVKERTVNLVDSIDIVQDAASQSSIGAEQISGAMNELANATNDLAEGVHNVDNQAKLMGEHIQAITENVGVLANASDDIKSATETAQEMMLQVLDSSDQSAVAVKDISESIDLTNESIKKITEAVNLITEIAAQTNLLSLNASIEAARAGDAGKGFAIVAEEIGKLATDSASTAEQIREIATDMTGKSSKTVELAGKIDTIIQEEKDSVSSTQRAFEMLGASIEESLAMIAEIDTKAGDLLSLKEGIIDNISSLSAISEQNAASNQEVTASVSSIAERVNDMSCQSNSMQEMSDQLREVVSYFR